MANYLLKKLAGIATAAILFTGCKPISAAFDQYSYTQLSSVKVDVMNVLDRSTEDYNAHESEVSTALTEMRKAKEYDTHKPNNFIMAKMWAVMDTLLNGTQPLPVGGNLKGLIPTWKKKGKLSAVFAQEAEAQIAEGFDLLMELESKKIKDTDAQVTSFLNK